MNLVFYFHYIHSNQKIIGENYPCPKKPYLDIILEAGDLLYIPRGWWHDPVPIGDDSLHLAIGTYPILFIDYIRWISERLPNIIEARYPLTSFENDRENIELLSEKIKSEIDNYDNYLSFCDYYRSEQRNDSNFNLELFSDVTNKSKINDDDRISLNINYHFDSSKKYLISNGIKVNFDKSSYAVIKLLSSVSIIKYLELKNALVDINEDKLLNLIYDLVYQDILCLYK